MDELKNTFFDRGLNPDVEEPEYDDPDYFDIYGGSEEDIQTRYIFQIKKYNDNVYPNLKCHILVLFRIQSGDFRRKLTD